ncbi:hypothetical protein GSI_00589 [Ganoderma sinense ZZ0214-1]|uniref:Uncharacterized protein n=1 Tax=Ganoderma sinense ZZ0214-1 TaxID=1077348 RepID=A0A2G8ST00_9APHY|nr:hypothetical protein GSI_00589 [Ganoderma sinense ZZ0214-1]
MPPKRELRESTSTEDSEATKRPRKSARTTAGGVTTSSASASGANSSTVEAVQDVGIAAKAHNDDPTTSAALDDASARTMSSPRSDNVPDDHGSVVSSPSTTSVMPADPVGSKGKAVDLASPATPGPRGTTTLADIRGLFSFIDYVPDDTIRRLMPFARKSDEANHRYALSSIPPGATWGTTSDTDSLLCVDNKPITIWAVGNTESPWFVTPEGQPHSRVNIGYRLPFDGDLAVVKKLFEKARPKRTDLKDVVFSAKRMTTYGAKSGKTIIPFKNVYDATERFLAKSNMDLLPPGVLGKRDIVLVESFFTRWRMDRDKENRRKWVKWNVGLELQAVNLLYEAPPDLVEQLVKEPEPAPDFDDDM